MQSECLNDSPSEAANSSLLSASRELRPALEVNDVISTQRGRIKGTLAPKPGSSFIMSLSYKFVKMLSLRVDVCLDVNQCGTNSNRCIQRLIILHAQTILL